MNIYRKTLAAVVLCALTLCAPRSVLPAQPPPAPPPPYFTPGNLAVVRVGGSGQYVSAPDSGNTVSIDQYTTNGVFANTLSLPSSGSNAFVLDGSPTEAYMTLSPNNQYLVLGGYHTALPYLSGGVPAQLSFSPSATVPRAVVTIDAHGNYAMQIANTNVFSTYNIRGAVYDGTANYWVSGAGGTGGTIANGEIGVVYAGTAGSSGVNVTVGQTGAGNERVLNIYNNTLYVSTGASTHGVFAITPAGTLPTTTGSTTNNVLALSTGSGSSPYDFVISPDNSTAYVADSSFGIIKFSNNGAGWVSNYTIVVAVPAIGFAAANANGVTADFTQTPPVLYATTAAGSGNCIVSIVDSGPAATATFLAQSSANASGSNSFRGIRFVPGTALVVSNQPTSPYFIAEPHSSTNLVGGTVTLIAAASGSGALSYQWNFNGSPMTDNGSTIVGSLTPTLVLSSLMTNESGIYTVVVTGGAGTNPSQPATIVVTPPTPVSIAYLRSLFSPVTFTPSDTATFFQITGTVITGTNLTSGNTSSFYIQDSTDGINVFIAGGQSFQPALGDVVQATGQLSAYENNLELYVVPGTYPETATYGYVTASGAVTNDQTQSITSVLPPPKLLPWGFTANAANTPFVTSNLDGSYVYLTNVYFVNAGEYFDSPTDTVYVVTNNTGLTFNLFLSAQVTNLDGLPIPTNAFSVAGALVLYGSIYELDITRYADIVTNQPTLTITNVPAGGYLGCNPTNLPTVALISNAVTLVDSCSGATYSVTETNLNFGCSNVLSFTINASDACSNLATASVTYTYTTATLALTNVPAGGYLGCNPTNLPTLAGVSNAVTLVDSCSAASYSVTETNFSFPCSNTVIFTITANDACGDHATAFVTYFWTTATLALTNVPAGGYLGCNPTNLPTLGSVSNAVTLVDSCSAASYSVTETNFSFPCSNTVIFTITANDACGDHATAFVTYFWTTATLALTNVPAGGYLGCNPTNLPTLAGVSNAVTLVDSCSAASYSVTETNFSFPCSNTVIFTITANDACGDHATAFVTYFWTTATLALTNVPAGGYLGCNPTNLPTLASVSNAVTVVDSCSASSYSVIESNFNFGCTNGLVFYIYASDTCGDHASASVTYTYTTAILQILGVPGSGVLPGLTLNLGCNPTNLPTDTTVSNGVELLNSCSTGTYVVTHTNLNLGCSNALIFTIAASDSCGDHDSTNVTYTWEAATLALTNVPAGGYLGCNPTNLPTLATVSNAVTLVDSCSAASYSVTETNFSFPCSNTVIFTITANDACGDHATAFVTYFWTTATLALTNVPAGGYLGCNPTNLPTLATVSNAVTLVDSCSAASYSVTETNFSFPCSNTVIFTITANDACGDHATAFVTYFWTTATLALTNVPAGGYLGCNPTNLPTLGSVSNAVTLVDSCSAASYSVTETNFSFPCSNTVIFTITANDACGDHATAFVTYFWTTATLALTNVPAGGYLGCNPTNLPTLAGVSNAVTLVDSCSAASYSVTETNFSFPCSNTVIFTITANDACGDHATAFVTYFWTTATLALTNVPAGGYLGCNPTNLPTLGSVSNAVTLVDSCSAASYSVTETNFSFPCSNTVIFTITANDACGDHATAFVTYFWTTATLALTNVPAGGYLGCNPTNLPTLASVSNAVTVVDSCSASSYSVIESNFNFGCTNGLVFYIYASDTCGDHASASVTYTYTTAILQILGVPGSGVLPGLTLNLGCNPTNLPTDTTVSNGVELLNSCSTGTYVVTHTNLNLGCSNALIFTIAASDSCGDHDSTNVTYTWEAATLALTNVPAGGYLGCNPTNLPTLATVSNAVTLVDSCSAASYSVTETNFSFPCSNTVIFTITANDACGDHATAFVTYFWTTATLALTNVPAGGYLGCNPTNLPTLATVSNAVTLVDSCSAASYSVTETNFSFPCSNTVIFTITANDACGDHATAFVTYFWTTATLALTNVPAGGYLGCNPTNLPTLGSVSNAVTLVDSCSAASYSVTETNFSFPCSNTVIFTITANDACGDHATAFVTYFWTTATLALTNVPAGGYLGCNPTNLPTLAGVSNAVTLVDSCSAASYSVTETNFSFPCSNTVIFTITANDACGDHATAFVTYFWTTATLALTNVPAGGYLGCNPTNLPTLGSVSNAVTLVDSCSAASYSVTETNFSFPCSNTVIFTITANDACGDHATASVTYTYTTAILQILGVPGSGVLPGLTLNLGCNPTNLPTDTTVSNGVELLNSCSTGTYVVTHTNLNLGCSNALIFTIAASDSCGDHDSTNVTYTYSAAALALTNVPTGGYLGCNPTNLPTIGSISNAVSVSDNGGPVTITVTQTQSTSPVLPQEYFVADVDTLPGAGLSQATAVNNNGEVVGQVVLIASGATRAFSFTSTGGMTVLGTLPGGTFSEALGVNDSGLIVGQADTASGATHAFSYTSAGGMIDLGALPGGNDSLADGVNDSGEVVGWSDTGGGANHAFSYTSAGGMVDLGTLPGGGDSQAYAINNSGEIVGAVQTSSGTYHAFSYTSAGGMIDLGSLTGASGYSQAYAVNNSGKVVGFAITASGAVHAFSYTSAGGMIDLGTLPGDNFSAALAVNDSGLIVGTNGVSSVFDLNAFVYVAGTMIDLNSLIPATSPPGLANWVLLGATGINNSGQIAGNGLDPSGNQVGFLLTPAVSGQGCVVTQLFTITATGACGACSNTATAYVTNTWTAATLTLNNVPVGGYLGCNPTNLPTLTSVSNAVTLVDSCSAASYSVIESNFNFGCTNSLVFYIYASDACGDQASASVTYTWTEAALVFTNLPIGGYLGCNPINIPSVTSVSNAVSVSDNQGLATITVSETQFVSSVSPPEYSIIDLGILPGAGISGAVGVNDGGEVVGWSGPIDVGDHAFSYSAGAMTDLGTLPGDSWSQANAVNNSGEVVGWSGTGIGTGSPRIHAFYYTSTAGMTDLGTLPGGASSVANGVNDSGQVVGYLGTGSGAIHAFSYSAGTMTDLGTLPGGAYSVASGVNDGGQVVGSSGTSSGATHAFSYSSTGGMIDLGTLPGGNFSVATNVNNSGEIVGLASTSSGATHAFSYTSTGGMIDLGTLPGGAYSGATGVNGSGQVVGSADTSGGATHAFVSIAGTMYDLNSLIPPGSGWDLEMATAINDNGQIAGNGFDSSTFMHAFLLTPAVSAQGCVVTQLLTITATGACGACSNIATAYVTNTWTTATLAITNVPTGGYLGCNPTNLPTLTSVSNAVTLADSCSAASFSVIQSNFNFGCSNSLIFYIYASDACGDHASAAVSYTWTEATLLLTNVPDGGYLGCNPTNLPTVTSISNVVALSDSCSAASYSVIESNFNFGCTNSLVFYVYASDTCGSTASAQVTYTYTAAMLALTNVPTGGYLGCNPTNLPTIVSISNAVSVSDNGGPAAISVTETQSSSPASTSEYSITHLSTLPGGSSSGAAAVSDSGEVVGSSGAASGATHAFSYTSTGGMFDLGTLPGGTVSQAFGVNNGGEVVGAADTSSGPTHAFSYTTAGGMVDLGTLPGYAQSAAYGLNDSDQVVGYAETGSGVFHAFSYTSAGGMLDLGTLPGGPYSQAYAVNNNGQVVGWSDIDGSHTYHAFSYTSAGGMLDLGTLGGTFSQAFAVNDGGEVVGSSKTSGNDTHAFSYSAGTMTDLGTLPGGIVSQANAVNNNGEVVGWSITGSGATHAFVYIAATMVDLNSLIPPGSGWELQQATAINDSGQIAGDGFDPSGILVAFLLTPAVGQGCVVTQLFTITATGTCEACSNTATAYVTNTWTTATLAITNVPAGGYLGCNPTNLPTVTSVSNAVILADSCSAAGYSVIESNSNFGCSNSLVFYIYASDTCGDHASAVVTYTYTTAFLSIYPITPAPDGFVPVGNTVMLGCNPTNLPTDTSISNSVALADSCSTGTYFVTHTNFNFGCSNVLIFTIAASDACGNQTSTNVTYTWTAATLTLTNVPIGGYLGCNPTNIPTAAGVSNAISVADNEGAATINVIQTQSTGPSAPQEYSITDLGTLPGGNYSQANGINGSGDVVGVSATGSGVSHAFLYLAGTMTDLGTLPGDNYSQATAVNNSGQVVGWSANGSGLTHAFSYLAGTMADLGTLPGDTSSQANAVNNGGQVVGWSANGSGLTHAFSYLAGTMTDLGTLPGGTASQATGVNDSGQVVGWAVTSSGLIHAFSYSAGTMTDLGALPGDNYSQATAVNNSGQVVGWSANGSGLTHAFSYLAGTMTDLGALPGVESEALGENDSGQIVGTNVTGTGVGRAFVDIAATMLDLNSLIPPGSGWNLWEATAINNSGQVVGNGIDPSGRSVPFLLTPAVSAQGCVVTQLFTITVTGACGACSNTATAYVTNTWTTATLAITNVPTGGYLGCNPTNLPTLASVSNAVMLADSCSAATYSVIESNFNFGCTNSLVFYTYAIDACGDHASAVVTYTYTTAFLSIYPITPAPDGFVPVGNTVMLGCNPTNVPTDTSISNSVALADSCSTGTYFVTHTNFNFGCSNVLIFTIAASDACGNQTSTNVTYTWTAATLTLTNVPIGGYLGCNPTNIPTAAGVSNAINVMDNEGAATISVTETQSTGAASPSEYSIADLGTLPGGNYSQANAINGSGEVVGWAYTSSGATHAFSYTSAGGMVDLGTLPGGMVSGADGVNDNGEVVGWADTASGATHAFSYTSAGGMLDLGTLPGGNYSQANAINGSGEVVGWAYTSSGTTHAFSYTSTGGMTDLGELTVGGDSEANAVNNNNEIVGWAITASGATHAFSYTGAGGMLDLGTLPGGTGSGADGVNDSGEIVGWASTANGAIHAFSYTSTGGMTDLGTLPGGTISEAFGVNDGGEVVGVAGTSNGEFPAFVYVGGRMLDLNSLIPPGSGWDLLYATNINASGQIIGGGIDPSGRSAAFLLTPAISGQGCVVTQVFTITATGTCGACSNTATAYITNTWTTATLAFTNLPFGGYLGCNPTNLPTIASISNAVMLADSCAAASYSVIESNFNFGCTNSLVFYIYASDTCGDQATASVTYTWTDAALVFTNLPTGGYLGCNPTNLPTLTSVSNAVILAESCSAASYSVIESNFNFGCTNSLVFYIYASDTCGDHASASVTYTWADAALVFTNLPTGGYLGCNPTNLPTVAGVSNAVMLADSCNAASYSVIESNFNFGCTNSLVFYIYASDTCGDHASAVVTYTYTTAFLSIYPISPAPDGFVPIGNTVMLGCNPTNVPTDTSISNSVALADSCSIGTYNVTHTNFNFGCSNVLIFTIAASDACGNQTSTNVTYTWSAATLMLTNVPVGGDLGCNPTNIPTAAGVSNAISVTDNKGAATISVTEIQSTSPASPSEYSITDLGTLPGGDYSLANGISGSGEVVGASGTASGATHAFSYTSAGGMTDLGTLPGGVLSQATAVNNSGEVVGWASTASGATHAFSYTVVGGMTDLGTLPGGTFSEAFGVNNSGLIVGQAVTSGGATHAFSYLAGTMTDLGTLPGGTFSQAFGVNDSGEVVGWAGTGGGATHAFSYTSAGGIVDLGTLPGGTVSLAFGVNNGGEVVGLAATSSGQTLAFSYSAGTMMDLGTLPGGGLSEANAINNSGQIVGTNAFGIGPDPNRAFIDIAGVMIDLNGLIPSGSGWVLQGATGINNGGQVVGNGIDPSGRSVPFLLTPAVSAQGCVVTQLFTITATGACGVCSNTATAYVTNTWTTATLAITNVPAGGDLGCNPTNLPTVTSVSNAVTLADSCSAVTYSVTESNLNFGCSNLLIFTISASDACGDHATAFVTYSYTTATLTLECGNLFVTCGSPLATNPPGVISCCTNVTVTLISNVVSGFGCTNVLTQTWQAVDCCGQIGFCTRQVFEVPVPPVLECSNLFVTCGSPLVTNPPGVISCCTNVTVTLISNAVSGFGCTNVLTQTWQAVDCCGQIGFCSRQVFEVPAPPVLECSNLFVTCGSALATNPPGVISCCTNVTVTLISNVVSGFGCTNVLTQTWQAVDCCGQIGFCSRQVFEVPAPPVLECSNLFVTCGSALATNPPGVISCCTNVTVTLISNVVSGFGCTNVLTQTWQAVDCCGQIGFCSRQVFEVPAPPVLECSNLFVMCDSPLLTNPPAVISCCTEVTVALIGSVTNGTGCSNVIIQIWEATDCCSNTITCTRFVTVVATLTISGVPAGGSLGCNPTNLPTNPEVKAAVTTSDSCSKATVTVSHQDTTSGCATTRTFTISASDTCGNTSTATVVYTWTTATLAISGKPAGGNLGCNPTNLPTVTSVSNAVTLADSCSAATYFVTSEDSTTNCTTTRTFTINASDTCGDTATATVTYTWKTATLTITILPSSGYLGCNPTNLPTNPEIKAGVTTSDACSTATVTVSHQDTNNGCTTIRIFTIAATDACGDTATAFVTNTWTTATLTISGKPSGGDLGCNPTNLPTVTSVSNAVTLADSCSTATYFVTSEDSTTNCTTTRTFTINASDTCGDTATATVTYTWKTATLTITGTPSGGSFGCNPSASTLPTNPEIKAGVTTSDACSTATVTVSHQDTTNGCITIRIFTIVATDACGDTATAFVTNTWTTATLQFASLPAGSYLGCNPPSLPTVGSVSKAVTLADSCSTASYSVLETNSNLGCTNLLIFTITASDTCGNQATATVTYSYAASPSLAFSGVPADAYLGCNPAPANIPSVADIKGLVSVTDNEGKATISVTQTQTTGPAFPPEFSVTSLGTLAGGTFSVASNINNIGTVVGWADTSSGATHAFSYSAGAMTDLGTLPGGTVSEAYGVNNNGQVVGSSGISGGTTRAFSYLAGTMTDLGTLPGGAASGAFGVNDSGEVVGFSGISDGATHAFSYLAGTMTDLGTLGGFNSEATGINDSGEVVGVSAASTGAHAFSYFAGTMTDLGNLTGGGAGSSQAAGVNNSGEIVGWSVTSSGVTHAFSYSAATMADLGTLPGDNISVAVAVNNSGAIVGYSYLENGTGAIAHAFVYLAGTMFDLNSLIPPGSGWILEAATGINDNGQIVGYGIDPSGRAQIAFLLTPLVTGQDCLVTQIFTITADGACGACSNMATAYVTNTWTTAAAPVILASNSVCANSTNNTASGPTGEATYAWTATGGTITSDVSAQTVTFAADDSGKVVLTLTIVNPCGCSAQTSATIAINPVPATPAIKLTPASVAPNSAGNTASGPAGASSWTWTITNGAITSSAGMRTITYTAGGSGDVVLTLKVANASGCTSQNSATVPITP